MLVGEYPSRNIPANISEPDISNHISSYFVTQFYSVSLTTPHLLFVLIFDLRFEGGKFSSGEKMKRKEQCVSSWAC